MELNYSNNFFVPYDTFDSLYSKRTQPEFGRVESPYTLTLDSWKFFHCTDENDIPFGFEGVNFDDSDWDIINVPSTWQTEGYGLPQNLLYDYPAVLEKKTTREESISDKILLHSVTSENDDKGIYRTSVVFTPEDIDRAIYLEISGIAGFFKVYMNGQLIADSHAVLTPKKLLLSNNAKEGVNYIVILVNRYDRDSKGHVIKEIANFGFSGIFRPLYINKESLLEMSDVHITTTYVPAAYINTLTTQSAVEHLDAEKIKHGNFRIRAELSIRNHTDFMMPYSVNMTLVEVKSEYDPYKLPIIPMEVEEKIEGTIDANTAEERAASMMALDVSMWTDATPVQYDLVIELLDSEERCICAKRRRFGFKTTEVTLNKLNLNDRIVPINAVKYYEFDAKNGIAVPLDTYRHDIIMMKRCGINTVIIQAFPVSDDFLDLCDQYGIYVIALSGTGFIESLVRSACNHPSIIFWGFPDYGFDSNQALKVKKTANLIDPTRPWYCAPDTGMIVSSIPPMPGDMGVVYGPWADLCLDRKNLFAKNKLPNGLFVTVPGRTFFDDDNADYKWLHHADLIGGNNREDSGIGQGIVDSERNPHPIFWDIKKQCQWITVFPQPENPMHLTLRNTNPFAFTDEVLLEWQLLLGGRRLTGGKGLIGPVEPYGTRTLKFPYDVAVFLMPGWANGNGDFIDLYMEALSHEIVLDVSLKLSKDTYYASEGFEVSFYQDVIIEDAPDPVAIRETTNPALASGAVGIEAGESVKKEEPSELIKPEIENDGDGITTRMEDTDDLTLETSGLSEGGEETNVSEIIAEEHIISSIDSISLDSENIKVGFDRRTGGLSKLSVGNFDFLCGNMEPSFYRCPSNIDRTDKRFVLAKTVFSKEKDYEEIQSTIEYKGCTYTSENGVFHLISKYDSFAMKGDILVYYEVLSGDHMRVTLDFTPKYDMLRYGFRVPIASSGILAKWYGRGPGESYYDRKNATKIGVFAAGANKVYHSYARPSENSSHTDTAMLELIAAPGKIRVFRGSKRFDFTILPYTPESMNANLHEEQLVSDDKCYLFLDFCSKEIERTEKNVSSLPLKKNVHYRETFDFVIINK